MFFILIDDIEADRHYPMGDLLNAQEMAALCEQCDVVSAHCFPSLQLALDWNASQ